MPSATLPTSTWLEDLHNNGFAIVKNAVPKDRAEGYVQSMYKWLETFPFGFKKDDKSTWTKEHLPKSMKFVACLFLKQATISRRTVTIISPGSITNENTEVECITTTQ